MLCPGLHQQCPRTIFQGQRRNTQRKDVMHPRRPRPQNNRRTRPRPRSAGRPNGSQPR